MGMSHSLVIMEETINLERHIFFIGNNSDKTFGFETGGSNYESLKKIVLPEGFRVGPQTKVTATEKNSFIGDWEEETPILCNNSPQFLFFCPNNIFFLIFKI